MALKIIDLRVAINDHCNSTRAFEQKCKCPFAYLDECSVHFFFIHLHRFLSDAILDGSPKNSLLHSGHTESEIEAATIEATKTRRGRHDTVKEIKQKYKALLEAGSLGEAKRLYQQRQPLSPVPSSQSTTRRKITTGLTPSPIIPRKNSPLRITAPHLSPTTSQLRHLQFPSSPDGGVFSPRFNVLPRRKRAAPIDLGDDLFASSCSSSAFSSSYNARSSPKRVCSPKPDGSGSPRSLFVSSSSVVRVPSSPRRRPLSPFVDKRPLMQPRRVASPPSPMLYQQRTPPRAM